MAYKTGIVIALILLVPIVITFIVSVSTGGVLAVFAVLTASMLLIASLLVVPLLSTRRRMTKSILAGIISLLLIFFFVDRMNGGGEFVLWTIPTVFGLSIVFFPLIIRDITLPPVLADKKALMTLTWDTLWLIFLTARYLPVNVWIKAGLIIIISCVWTAFTNDVYVYFAEHKKQLTILSADFSDWSNDICFNANFYIIVLILGGIAGGGLLLYGIVNMKRKRLKK